MYMLSERTQSEKAAFSMNQLYDIQEKLKL